MMPHWIFAVRSRKRVGSLPKALTSGMARNTYTGMNTVKRSKCSVATMPYCSGSTTKKASSRLRWSPRRVCVSVTNSRSATKESTPNSSVETKAPDAQATQNSTAPSQTARRSRTNWSKRSWSSLVRSRTERVVATMLTMASKPNSTTNSRPICWVTVRSLSAPMSLIGCTERG